MDSRKTRLTELSEKVLEGMRIAIRELVETAAANNKELVIGDKDGNIKHVPAKELLKTLQ